MTTEALAPDEIKVEPTRCMFAEESAVAFNEVEATGDKSIRIQANSGRPILNHWWWGNFAIDLKGLKIGRKKKPILLDHRSSQIVGYTSKIYLDDKDGLVAEGTILSGDSETFAAGNRVRELAEKGYPWQASVYVPPTEVERVRKGTFAIVNGHKLQGPGHIFRKSILREVTVTSMGADENTDAELLGEGRREAFVSKLTDSTPTPADEASGGGTQQLSIEVTSDPGKVAESLSTPEAAETIRKVVKKSKESDPVEARLAEERHRVSKLTDCAEPHQKAMLSAMIADGTELAVGLEALLKDQQEKRSTGENKLKHLEENSPPDLGFAEVTEGEGGETKVVEEDKDAFVERCKAKFTSSKALQEEFMSEENYISFCHIDMEVANEGSL